VVGYARTHNLKRHEAVSACLLAFAAVVCPRAADAAPAARPPLRAHVTHTVSAPAAQAQAPAPRKNTVLKGGVERQRAGNVAPHIQVPRPRGIMPESAPGALRLKAKIVTATRTRVRYLVEAGKFDEAERITRCAIAAFPNDNPLAADLAEIRLAKATDNVYTEDLSALVDRVEQASTPDDAGCCGSGRARAAAAAQMQDVMGPVAGY